MRGASGNPSALNALCPDAAIVRHGRCLTNLEFPEFTEMEAHEWFASRGDPSALLPRKRTLSDLYAATGSQASIVNVIPPKCAGSLDNG
jgi:hypothetical protein